MLKEQRCSFFSVCGEPKETNKKQPQEQMLCSQSALFVHIHSLCNHKSKTANDMFCIAAFSGWLTMTKQSSELVGVAVWQASTAC